MKITESYLYNLSINDIDKLIDLITNNNLNSEDLTMAAEFIGSIKDSEKARTCLIPLLKHPSAIVREGVIYGLANHMNDYVISCLEKQLKKEGSLAVCKAIKDVLST